MEQGFFKGAGADKFVMLRILFIRIQRAGLVGELDGFLQPG